MALGELSCIKKIWGCSHPHCGARKIWVRSASDTCPQPMTCGWRTSLWPQFPHKYTGTTWWPLKGSEDQGWHGWWPMTFVSASGDEERLLTEWHHQAVSHVVISDDWGGVSGDRVSGLSKQRTQAHSWGRGHMGRSEPQPAHVTFHAPVTAPECPEGANAPPISFSAASAECLGTRLWASWMDCRLQSGWNWVPVPALLTGPCP